MARESASGWVGDSGEEGERKTGGWTRERKRRLERGRIEGERERIRERERESRPSSRERWHR